MTSTMLNTEERMAQLPADVPRDAVIVTRNLQREYDMGGEIVRALRGVDLTIRKNEFVAVMGPSGSGKSTLMNLIGCLDSPTAGEYWLNGHRVSELGDDQLARIRNKTSVNFTGVAAPGDLTEVEIEAATSTTLAGDERLLARAG